MRLWISLFSVAALGATAPAPSLEGPGSIRDEDMRRHVEFLAADELRGRDTGEPTIAIAERYVATALASYGLEPLPGQEDLAVPFTLYRRGYDREASGVVLDGSRYRAGTDCRPFEFSENGSVEAEVVFAGYGIHAPDQGWNDYDGLDVKGKLVLVLRHGPGEGDSSRTVSGDHQQFTVKGQKAREQGAAGMLLVTDPLNHEPGEDFRLGGRLSLTRPDGESPAEDEAGFVALHVSREFAERLVAGSERTLSALQEALDGGTPTSDLSIGAPVATATVLPSGEPEQVAARNVVGVLPGTDPDLRDEWVLVGAHHDHVGAFVGQGDTIFNGADDNASGVSGVLELAQAFASRGEGPARTMVFATFSAEEKGLLGSRALVEQGALPLDKLVFMLNLDMIGRNSEAGVQVFGDGYVRDLRDLVEQVNGPQGIELAFAGQSYSGNSDHDAFYRQGIPFMFFFTGTHEDYHQIGDHAEKLDYPRMQAITRLAYGVLDRWGSLDQPLSFIHRIAWLGIGVETREDAGRSVAEITSVERGSRAAEAGLREGDRLVKVADDEVAPRRVGALFNAIESGNVTDVLVERAGETRVARVERIEPGYMGVQTAAVASSSRSEHALVEGEGLLLRRVVPGGPSAKAGLESGDIVLRMDGQPVNDASLRTRLAQFGAGATVNLSVLRNGERIETSLTLGQRPRR